MAGECINRVSEMFWATAGITGSSVPSKRKVIICFLFMGKDCLFFVKGPIV
jgi:hypothetical protein